MKQKAYICRMTILLLALFIPAVGVPTALAASPSEQTSSPKYHKAHDPDDDWGDIDPFEDEFSEENLDEFGRPILSGPMLQFDTPRFRIHYTLSGDDAVAPTDDDGSGQPDYVEAVGQAMEEAWQIQIVQLGWPAPPNDQGLGGDNRYDVYLQEMFDGGYADGGLPETIVGDNPNTPTVETRASFSYIGLDNNYDQTDLFTDDATLDDEFFDELAPNLDSSEEAPILSSLDYMKVV
ncbi:MAG: hypothetical protein AAF485_32965, partial [Chloroflexota bacterium]